MKRMTGKALAILALGLGLSACQKQDMDPAKAQFQMEAGNVVGKYAGSVSKAVRASIQSSASRGVVSGGWDPFSGGLFGNSVQMNSIDAEASRCLDMTNQIPRQARYFYLRLGTLARCMDVVVNYRNPLLTYGYRNLDYGGQYAWGYDLNYARPQLYNQFSSGDYQFWQFFAGNGLYRNQVQDYRVPGFGF